MTKRFCITNTGDNDEDEADGIETALILPAAFTGTCYHCGKVGHRKDNCLLLKGVQGEVGSMGSATFVVNVDTRKKISGKKMRTPTNVHTTGYQE